MYRTVDSFHIMINPNTIVPADMNTYCMMYSTNTIRTLSHDEWYVCVFIYVCLYIYIAWGTALSPAKFSGNTFQLDILIAYSY